MKVRKSEDLVLSLVGPLVRMLHEKLFYTKIQMRTVFRTILLVKWIICVSYFEAMSETVHYIFDWCEIVMYGFCGDY